MFFYKAVSKELQTKIKSLQDVNSNEIVDSAIMDIMNKNPDIANLKTLADVNAEIIKKMNELKTLLSGLGQ